MNTLQSNGEPKKILLIKQETPTTNNEAPTTSLQSRSLRSCSGDAVRIPPRRHQTPVDKNSEEYMSNHKKQRYWNSWEELYLVELWHRYKDEVTTINVPLPVYRKIMVSMRNRNMVVTAQDCRRKINTLNTRYKQELAKVESTGCKSEWRLFPLLHCVIQPKIKEFDPWHEIVIIKKLLDKIPKPVEVPAPAPINNNINHHTPQTQPLTSTAIITHQPRTHKTSVHNPPVPSVFHSDSNTTSNHFPSSHGRSLKHSIMPFRNITVEKLEQIRQDNNRLAEQRDADLKELHMEEANFQNFETFMHLWMERKKEELSRVQSVINMGNEENHNSEK